MLEKLHPANSSTEHLFVGTDQYMYFVLSWDAEKHRVNTEKTFVDQADKTARDSLNQDRCLIDPTHQVMALQLYDGIVTVIPLGKSGKKKDPSGDGTLGDPIPVRIPDLFIRSAAFLYSRKEQKEQPKLAFLYEDIRQMVCLSIRILDHSVGTSGEAGSADLEDLLDNRTDLDLGASHLIPVPAPACVLPSYQES
jgi:DNA damage-binding protein 1